MGIFFRKSIKLGKHTRVNLSKMCLGTLFSIIKKWWKANKEDKIIGDDL